MSDEESESENVIEDEEDEIVQDEESEKEVSPPKTEAETKKQAPSIHTKEDDLKSNNNNVYNIDNSKTIFTKLTEEMFDNLYSPSKKSKYVYDSFINEQFLSKYSEKFNDKNNRIVNNFMERICKETEKKRLGIITQEKNEHIKPPPGRMTTYGGHRDGDTHRLTSGNKENFISEQKKFVEKKNKKINELKSKLFKEENKNIRNIPQICNKSREMSKTKTKNVFDKLYEDNQHKFKKTALLLPKDKFNKTTTGNESRRNASAKTRMNKEEIEISVDKLHRGFSQSKKQIKIDKNSNKSFELTSKSSNELLAQKFLKNYDLESNKMFNYTSDTNHSILFIDFVKFLFHLGFVVKEYNATQIQAKNKEKELQLLKDAWKVLTRKTTDNSNEKIDSHYLILFLLCVMDLYRGEISPLIMKIIPCIDIKKYSISEKLSKQIKIFFRLLRDNEMNYIFKNNNYELFHSFANNENLNELHVKKPKMSKIRSENNLSGKRLNLTEAYDLSKKKREQQLQILRKEKEQKEEKECTFFPNGKNPKSRSSSREVHSRLYSQRKKKSQTTNNDKSVDSSLNDKFKYTFRPTLTKYNKRMFNYNPIKDDRLVNEKLEQYEKARIDKKVSNYLLKQGTHSISQLKTFDEVVNDIVRTEVPTRMKFDNEYGGYKNTFDKYKKKPQKKDKREIKFIFEIKVEDAIKKLKIYKGDDIEKVVDKFCIENNLEMESKEQILSAIRDKL